MNPYITAAQAEARKVIGCINSNCNKNGVIIGTDRNGDPEWEPCQYCSIRDTLIADTFEKGVAAERGRAVDIIKEKLREAPLEVQMTKGIIFADIVGEILMGNPADYKE